METMLGAGGARFFPKRGMAAANLFAVLPPLLGFFGWRQMTAGWRRRFRVMALSNMP